MYATLLCYGTAWRAVSAVVAAVHGKAEDTTYDRNLFRAYAVSLDALRPFVADLPDHPEFYRLRGLLVALIDDYQDLIATTRRRRLGRVGPAFGSADETRQLWEVEFGGLVERYGPHRFPPEFP